MKRQTIKHTPAIIALALALTAMAAGVCRAQETAEDPTIATVASQESAAATTETADSSVSSLARLKELFPSGVVPKLKVTGSEDDVSLRKVELRRLLSAEETTFVYDHGNRRDPMLLPWTHFRHTASMAIKAGEKANNDKNLSLAQKSFETALRLAARMEASGFRLKAMTDLIKRAEKGVKHIESEKIRRSRELEAIEVAEGKKEPELPKWVRANTTGVLYSPNNPMCLVGFDILGIGDMVPDQPLNVKVQKIDKLSVTFYVSSLNNLIGKSFVVSLEEGE